MSFLFPSYSPKYSKKDAWLHWIKVSLLLCITAVLTWYGMIYKPEPALTYVNEFSVWVVPHKRGLGALVALPNDNSDSVNTRTGLRIWVSPPDSILLFESYGIRYRGRNIVVVGDTIGDGLRKELLSTLDSNGNLFWLSGLGHEYTGYDVSADLRLIGGKPQDYVLDVVYNGYKLRFFGSQAALDSAGEEPLSAALLMFKPEAESEPPFKHSELAQVLIWNGKNGEKDDASRIALNYADAYALVSYFEYKGLKAQRLHLSGWNPEL